MFAYIEYSYNEIKRSNNAREQGEKADSITKRKRVQHRMKPPPMKPLASMLPF